MTLRPALGTPLRISQNLKQHLQMSYFVRATVPKTNTFLTLEKKKLLSGLNDSSTARLLPHSFSFHWLITVKQRLAPGRTTGQPHLSSILLHLFIHHLPAQPDRRTEQHRFLCGFKEPSGQRGRIRYILMRSTEAVSLEITHFINSSSVAQ